MIKILKGNITKCSSCDTYLKYEPEDVKTEECSYGLVSYQGETYTLKYVICPKCKRKIEVYTNTE